MKTWTGREKQMNKQKYPKLQANGKVMAYKKDFSIRAFKKPRKDPLKSCKKYLIKLFLRLLRYSFSVIIFIKYRLFYQKYLYILLQYIAFALSNCQYKIWI